MNFTGVTRTWAREFNNNGQMFPRAFTVLFAVVIAEIYDWQFVNVEDESIKFESRFFISTWQWFLFIEVKARFHCCNAWSYWETRRPSRLTEVVKFTYLQRFTKCDKQTFITDKLIFVPVLIPRVVVGSLVFAESEKIYGESDIY